MCQFESCNFAYKKSLKNKYHYNKTITHAICTRKFQILQIINLRMVVCHLPKYLTAIEMCS